MKIAIPEAVTNSLRFKVGDLYAAGGNSSNTAFWLVVAITERGGKEYYRPAPADRCAAAIRARGNSAEGLV